MQENGPFVPRIIECACQLLDIGHHAEAALRVGVLRKDRRRPLRVSLRTGALRPLPDSASASAASAGRWSARSSSVSSVASRTSASHSGRHAVRQKLVI